MHLERGALAQVRDVAGATGWGPLAMRLECASTVLVVAIIAHATVISCVLIIKSFLPLLAARVGEEQRLRCIFLYRCRFVHRIAIIVRLAVRRAVPDTSLIAAIVRHAVVSTTPARVTASPTILPFRPPQRQV